MASVIPVCKSCNKTTCYPKADGGYYDFCRAGCIPRDTKVITDFKDILSRCAQCRINKRILGKPYCSFDCENNAQVLTPPPLHKHIKRRVPSSMSQPANYRHIKPSRLPPLSKSIFL